MKGTSGKDFQYVYLIDGFAGGGLYSGNKFGSPITILKAVEEAEYKINLGREKRTRIIPICYFIEQNRNAFECLNYTLKINNYTERVGKTIHVYNDRFDSVVPGIIKDINLRHKRGGNRTIFFLDQCGWTEISANLISDISKKLHHRPEFIVNFSISWLADFISAKTLASKKKSLQELGLEGYVDLSAMLNLQRDLGGRWQHAVEAHIGLGLHKATGISYYSPFYIEPEDNHRGYWLLHLAGSARARSAMTEVHWAKANRSRHYGYLGYEMLAYKPDLDATSFMTGMSFNEESNLRCKEVLQEDFARLITQNHGRGVSYKNLLDGSSNKILASAPMFNEVIWTLCQTSDFEISCPSGKAKRTSKIADHDVIRRRKQLIFSGF